MVDDGIGENFDPQVVQDNIISTTFKVCCEKKRSVLDGILPCQSIAFV